MYQEQLARAKPKESMTRIGDNKTSVLTFLPIVVMLIFSATPVWGQINVHALSIVLSDAGVSSLAEDSISSSTENLLKRETGVSNMAIYGGGSLFNTLTKQSSDESTDNTNTSAVGTIGITFINNATQMYQFHFSFNPKDQLTISSLNDMSEILLNPNSNGLSFGATGYWSLKKSSHPLWKRTGFLLSFTVSPQDWRVANTLDPNNTDTLSVSASPFLAKTGLFIQPFDFPAGSNTVHTRLELLLTGRDIGGDFSIDNEQKYVVGSETYTQRSFFGTEVGFYLDINDLQMYAKWTWNNTGDMRFSSFSGHQFAIGFDIGIDAIGLD